MNEKLAELAAAIYTEADGADHTEHAAAETQAIYEWLANGDGHEGEYTVAELAEEWLEYNS